MNGIQCALRASFFGLFLCKIVCGKYTDHWAVHIEGGEGLARAKAAEHGFHYVGMVRFHNFLTTSISIAIRIFTNTENVFYF